MNSLRNRTAAQTLGRIALRSCLVAASFTAAAQAANEAAGNAASTFSKYCYQCHGKAAMAGVNLQKLTSQNSMGESFQQWEKVAAALEQKRMPPPKMPQPSDAERGHAAAWIRTKLNEYAQKHAGDPGKVTVRRLTQGEYAYTIQDLTGIALKFDADSGSDAVGGEGFTNFGDVQFMQDANLERYLENAKRVADHAVIGAGPLEFYDDPGKSGLELSAVDRIQRIYQRNGFRSVAGEGGRPFGLELYGKAFYAAWRYQHRKALGEPKATLDQIAAREGITPRFAQHIWSVLHMQGTRFPISEVIAKWQKLPAPGNPEADVAARAGAKEVQQFVINWPRWLFAAGAMAEGGRGDERALLLSETLIKATPSHQFRFFLRRRRNAPARVFITAGSANPDSTDNPVLVWKNAVVRVRQGDRSRSNEQPLKAMLDEATIQKLGFGKLPDGTAIDPNDFAIRSGSTVSFDLAVPKESFGVELRVLAEAAGKQMGDAVLRLTISDREEASDGTPVSTILADPNSPGYLAWKKGVLEFAAKLPQNSHLEPTPSDKDPIPAPFNNTYNQPERDHYHVKLKYYRQDRFIVDNMLDDASRKRLDQAWNDLLGSFEYHDAFLSFVAGKYKLNLKKADIAELTAAEIEAIPEEPRQFVKALRAEYDSVQKALKAAEPGHIEDALRFAARAWRRPLTDAEKQRLRAFYTSTRQMPGVDHTKAVRSLLARILVAPAFLYRLEQPSQQSGLKPLSNWEMASRLSYFLWSSMPDEELARAAAAGELTNPKQIQRQVKRMLADPKARRLATEFFGQWLGFYQFDQFRGVDTTRFPEFTGEVKSAMYNEAVSFFEHVIRNDRPIREMYSADYTFVNKALAKHYGIKKEVASVDKLELVDGANAFQRGGLLRLGAVLTATSAPLRTSPVKRGDWMLRRILGTPTPPPPPDAGSIPADEKAFGGLTVRERLEAHKRNATCAGCHNRIDPLGFPLERYDSIGRWRDTYSDGKPVDDSSALADQTQIAGVDGLLQYLKSQEKQVLRTFSNKVLGYALGRTILASDQPLIERLTTSGSEITFSKLAAEIATSRQFRYRREQEESVPPAAPVQTTGTPAVKGTNKEGGL